VRSCEALTSRSAGSAAPSHSAATSSSSSPSPLPRCIETVELSEERACEVESGRRSNKCRNQPSRTRDGPRGDAEYVNHIFFHTSQLRSGKEEGRLARDPRSSMARQHSNSLTTHLNHTGSRLYG